MLQHTHTHMHTQKRGVCRVIYVALRGDVINGLCFAKPPPKSPYAVSTL